MHEIVRSIVRCGTNRTAVAFALGFGAFAAGLTASLWCSTPALRPPNILVIVVDTLNYEHISAYGDERLTSPAIDALATESARFARAYATAPWTIPSVASIRTGSYPSRHGATQIDSRLPAEAITPAEILSANGYVTAGVVSHILLTRRYGFEKGFDQFAEVGARDAHNSISTGMVTRRAQRFLKEFAGQAKPFYLFVHYFDPHYNYLRHPEYGFAPDSAGRLRGGEDIEALRTIEPDLTPAEFRFLGDIYDEEVRFTDDGIGRLFATLRELDLYDQTLIVLTGDHGEEFGDHGGLGHGRTLYDEVLRVPLVIRAPALYSSPRVIETPVSLVSLAPTLLEFAGIACDSLQFQGASLAPLLASTAAVSRVIYSEVDFDELQAHKQAVLVDRYKLIRDGGTGEIELYDVIADPHEQRNLATQRRDVVRGLVPTLDRESAAAAEGSLAPRSSPLSEDEIRRLRSLGYTR
jgi:arylsulfatase A-like enzyme